MISGMQHPDGTAQPNAAELSTRDAASLLGVDLTTLWRWRKRGIGPHPIRKGGQWRYREDEVRDYLVNGEQAS